MLTFVPRSYPPGLRRRWRALAAVSLTLLLAGAAWLGQIWPLSAVLGWAGLTAGVLLFQLWLLRRNLLHNYRPAEADRPALADLGWANLATLARGLPIAGFAGFLAAPLPLDDRLAWAPAALYALGVLPDFLDGALARLTHRVTVLGGILDMEYDSLAMLAVSLLAVRLGKVPAWYIGLGLARYLFVVGLWARARRGLPVFDLPPSNTRRLAAGFQMAFFCVALWPVFGPPATTIAGSLFVAPILIGFVRDWLVVSGALSTAAPIWQRLLRVRYAAYAWLPPLLRWIGGGAALLAAATGGWTAGSSGPAGWPADILSGLVGVSAAGLLLGAGTRLGAIGLLIAVCAGLAAGGYQPVYGVVLTTTIPLLFLGAGKIALWRGEDVLFERRLGE